MKRYEVQLLDAPLVTMTFRTKDLKEAESITLKHMTEYPLGGVLIVCLDNDDSMQIAERAYFTGRVMNLETDEEIIGALLEDL